jgi:hypothetical protein
MSVPIMKVALGTFACNGIEACLDTDIPSGVQAALSDFTQRIVAGKAPVGIPHLAGEASGDSQARSIDLSVDERTWMLLRREAARQGATLSQLVTHSVLVYLAELDRLTPPGAAETA